MARVILRRWCQSSQQAFHVRVKTSSPYFLRHNATPIGDFCRSILISAFSFSSTASLCEFQLEGHLRIFKNAKSRPRVLSTVSFFEVHDIRNGILIFPNASTEFVPLSLADRLASSGRPQRSRPRARLPARGGRRRRHRRRLPLDAGHPA